MEKVGRSRRSLDRGTPPYGCFQAQAISSSQFWRFTESATDLSSGYQWEYSLETAPDPKVPFLMEGNDVTAKPDPIKCPRCLSEAIKGSTVSPPVPERTQEPKTLSGLTGREKLYLAFLLLAVSLGVGAVGGFIAFLSGSALAGSFLYAVGVFAACLLLGFAAVSTFRGL